LIAQTRNGRQVLNLGDGEEAQTAIIIEPGHDHLAVLGANRKLLIFPLNELPVMTRGRGVILQRFAKGNLADVTTLNLKEGLSWRSGQQGMRTETDIKRWVGKRSQAGMVVPKGFSRANKFN
ncbi:MAG: DNA topoisomerase IV subunit A, partial [Alphaproteobacteria bacterium]|nr:DNA topoisomerase IV subunit A [Alphaproteobacteria bacterium]